MIHLAGPAITCGTWHRQRCSWCGTIIEDVDLSLVAIAICIAPLNEGEIELASLGLRDTAIARCGRSAGHQGEHDLTGQPGDFEIGSWDFESFVEIEGTLPVTKSLIEMVLHVDGSGTIPEGSCMALPPEITGGE